VAPRLRDAILYFSLSMSPYLIGLTIASVLVALAERLHPWRREQRVLRARLASDLAYLVFNAHFLGVFLYFIGERYVLPPLDALLARGGLTTYVHRAAAANWPVWLQIVVLVVVFDFVQWAIHRMLHAVPWLWVFHQVHHSVGDGEMDWIVSFRFHWMEAAIYKSLQYLLFAFFGFGTVAVLTQALVGTLIGHLNHANLDLGRGPWRYVINSPRMHLWHHAKDGPPRNFGIIFSAWDFLFGTAHLPNDQPAHLGFAGDDAFPRTIVGQELWPLSRLFQRKS